MKDSDSVLVVLLLALVGLAISAIGYINYFIPHQHILIRLH